MKLRHTYIKYRDKWWGLPLFLPSILLPVLNLANTYAQISSGTVTLFYLPLALLMSSMVFLGWAAIPGIIIALFIRKFALVGLAETLVVIAHFFIPVVLGWGGYRAFTPRRRNISHGNPRLMTQRILWQVICPATLFLILYQMITLVGFYKTNQIFSGVNIFSLNTLINYQALLVGNLTGIPMCYYLIRVLRNPFYLRSYFSQLRLQFDPKVSRIEIVLWAGIFGLLMMLLCLPLNKNSSIFSTNYTLSLLLPVMLWGSIRYGYRFISLIWTPLLIISIHYYHRYIPLSLGYDTQLAIVSSSYLIYSFIIIFISMLATQQRIVHRRARLLALLDPVVHLPNLRALNRSLNNFPWSVICFLRIPELERLGRNYGIMMRIQYKQTLANWITARLAPDECVYQLSGHDLVFRLNTEAYQDRIEELDRHIKQFRFSWDGMRLQPQVGISYCYVRSPVTHIYLLLGELSTTADLSLATNHPENLQKRCAINLQQNLKDKVALMNRLQHALENDQFRLMAQPIVGVRGDSYHEILLRLIGNEGEIINPDEFLPVAHEFGLSSRIDLWVLENTLRFMARHREELPASRFAINLAPSTVCRAHFPAEVKRLLIQYQVEAWQLFFEVTESNALYNMEQANQTLARLQQMGCQVAIDDFGTGYASYARLKSVDADILKIDGSFIRNIVSNSMDYQIVASICHLARMKKMRIVAEYVETEEVRSAVVSLGIDYLQGYLIGKPEPLDNLLAKAPKKDAQSAVSQSDSSSI